MDYLHLHMKVSFTPNSEVMRYYDQLNTRFLKWIEQDCPPTKEFLQSHIEPLQEPLKKQLEDRYSHHLTQFYTLFNSYMKKNFNTTLMCGQRPRYNKFHLDKTNMCYTIRYYVFVNNKIVNIKQELEKYIKKNSSDLILEVLEVIYDSDIVEDNRFELVYDPNVKYGIPIQTIDHKYNKTYDMINCEDEDGNIIGSRNKDGSFCPHIFYQDVDDEDNLIEDFSVIYES